MVQMVYMHKTASAQSSRPLFIPTMTSTECVIHRHNAHEIEVWGADISEHYAIYLAATGDCIADLIYLGAPDVSSSSWNTDLFGIALDGVIFDW